MASVQWPVGSHGFEQSERPEQIESSRRARSGEDDAHGSSALDGPTIARELLPLPHHSGLSRGGLGRALQRSLQSVVQPVPGTVQEPHVPRRFLQGSVHDAPWESRGCTRAGDASIGRFGSRAYKAHVIFVGCLSNLWAPQNSPTAPRESRGCLCARRTMRLAESRRAQMRSRRQKMSPHVHAATQCNPLGASFFVRPFIMSRAVTAPWHRHTPSFSARGTGSEDLAPPRPRIGTMFNTDRCSHSVHHRPPSQHHVEAHFQSTRRRRSDPVGGQSRS